MSWLDLYVRCEQPARIAAGPNFPLAAGTITLSAGTRLAAETPNAQAYDAQARVPREPWRPATSAELEALVAPDQPLAFGRTVYLSKLSGRLPPDVREALHAGAAEAIEAHIMNPLRRDYVIGEPVQPLGALRHKGGLPTTTRADAAGPLIGLHVDDWDNLEFERRDLSCNRVSVNLGEEARFLLFLPVTVLGAGRLLAAVLGPERLPQDDMTGLARLFMEMFPEVPVVRCRIGPGEAYIAATENLIHDGSSVGQAGADEQFVLLGRIRPRVIGPKPSLPSPEWQRTTW